MTPTPKIEKEKRIFWTQDEMRRLVTASIARYGIVGWDKPWQRFPLDLQASVLSLGRCREVKQEKDVPRLLPVIDELLLVAQTPRHVITAEPEPKQAKTEPAAEPEEIGYEELPLLEDEQESPLRDQLIDQASSFVADVLVESVRKFLTHADIARMLRSVRLSGEAEISREESSPRHKPDLSAEPEKTEVPSLLLCGFKPNQQASLMSAIQTNARPCRIKFWYADAPGSRLNVLSEKAKSAEAAFFTMEASSHSAVLTAQKSRTKVLRVTGGTQSMVNAVHKYLDTRKGATA